MISKYNELFDEIIISSNKLGYDAIARTIRAEYISVFVKFRENYNSKTTMETSLHRLFLSEKMTEYLKKHKIMLRDIGGITDISTYQDPLVYILSGDEEFAQYEVSRLLHRKEKNLLTLPLIVFSEGFFNIPYGEHFGYMDIIDMTANISQVPPVAFSERHIRQFNVNFDWYLWCTSYYLKILKCIEQCHIIIDQLINIITEISEGFDKYNAIEKSHIRYVLSKIQEKIEAFEQLVKDLNEFIGIFYSDYKEIQSKNDCLALKERKYFRGKSFSSSFGNKIELRYGDIIGLIDQFIDNVDQCMNKDQYALDNINETTALMNRPCEMAIVGTFSSGKTTFINSLLGGAHSFRTSASHNTAVLMTVKKNVDGQEKYLVKYRNSIEYDLIVPSDDTNRSQIYTSKSKAKVDRVDNSQRLIVIVNSDTGRKKTIYIDNDNKIIVKKGDVLDYGTRLTEGKEISADSERVKCVSSEDIKFFLTLITDKSYVKNVKIIVNGREKGERYLKGREVVSVLEHLSNILLPTPDRIYPTETVCSLPELKGKTHRLTFCCDYIRDDRRVFLNEIAWREFCDSDSETVFMEKPECFILAESLLVEMNSNFLEFCNIIDTPGFGSVTEKHDAISERCLRNHKGILLVMVRIDNKTDKLSFHTLINKITRIYNADTSLDKENVYFVLNCYSNLATKDSLTNSCRYIANMIEKRGFLREKIFACNLKESLKSGQYLDEQYQMPSYNKFIKDLQTDIEKKGIIYQLRQVREIWHPYLQNEIKSISNHLKALTTEKGIREISLKRKQELLSRLKSIKMKPYETIAADIRDEIEPLIDAVKGIDRKKNWDSQRKLICDAFDNIACQLNSDDFVMDSYKVAIHDVAKNSDNSNFSPTPIDSKMEKRFIFPAESLKSLYIRIGKRFWGLFWYKKDAFIDEMASEIENQVEIALKDYSEYYYYVLKLFENAKEKARSDLKNQIEALSSEDSKTQYIDECSKKLNVLSQRWNEWIIINRKIEELES